MRIHCDWDDAESAMAVTFDDEEDQRGSFDDFSKFLKVMRVEYSTFKLKGTSVPSMVVTLPEKCCRGQTNKGCCDTMGGVD